MAMTKTERVEGRLIDVFNRIKNPLKAARNPVICMYHSVSAGTYPEWGPWQYSVTPETFERQIEWLSKNRTPVTLDRIVDYLSGGGVLPKDSVVITFDDGYRDYRDTALPILETYDVPSTVYVPTQLMREQAAPYEYRLGSALLRADSARLELRGESVTFDLSTPERTRHAYSELTAQYKTSSLSERVSLINQLGGTAATDFTIMSPGMVKELGANRLVTVGSHSHEHRPLGEMAVSEAETNMSRSHTTLSDILGQSVSHFSFPYGSTVPEYPDIAAAAGYESAVTTEHRVLRPRDWNRCYTIPRMDMSNLAHQDGTVP